ncbi:hypothetical protein PHSC3_000970 [Chlamydiales bacterium STE3]|nr:hypothetical protein PHSC3_000970 [Chlamydiales bacterium STE3]
MISFIKTGFLFRSSGVKLMGFRIKITPLNLPLPGQNNFEVSFAERMQFLKNNMRIRSYDKPTVVILGAGPAGLIRAIISVCEGNPTTVIEKRPENAPGRLNTVAIDKHAVSILKNFGVYQYLLENKLIYPARENEGIDVRLGELEQALKMVLEKISPEPIIQYDSQVLKIATQSKKIALSMQSTNREHTLSDIDVLVNAEGARSSTNSLLGIKRKEVLQSIPAITAIYQDNRPEIQNVSSLLKSTRTSVFSIAYTINYHIQFLFRSILSKKFRQQICGVIILKTPKQNYIGCGFSAEVSDRIFSLKKIAMEKKEAIEKAKSSSEKKDCEREFKIAEKQYHSFSRRWIHLSLCFANMAALISFFRRDLSLPFVYHHNLKSFDVVKIGADKAEKYCTTLGESDVLLAGDASATVDPVTGLGCNTALRSYYDFQDYLRDRTLSQKAALENYNHNNEQRVERIHSISKEARRLYRREMMASLES